MQLGISPPKIAFNGSVDEKICKDILIYTNYREFLIGNDRWAWEKKQIRDISKYKFNSSLLKLNLEYPKKIKILNDSKQNIEVCLTAQKHGIYYGALFYSTEASPAGVGIWISANITEKEKGISLITGKVIDSSFYQNISLSKVLLVSPTILLTFILILLIRKKNKK